MKHIMTGLIALAACGPNQNGPDGALPEVDAEALAELGVSRVAVDSTGYVLIADDGTQVGEVRFDGATTIARLRGNEARTEITPDGMATSCNGEQLVLAGTSGSLDAAARLAPCAAALRAVSILIHPDAPVETTTDQNLLACYDAHIDGCVSWNIWQGCTKMQYCYVVWCDGGFSDYKCSVE